MFFRLWGRLIACRRLSGGALVAAMLLGGAGNLACRRLSGGALDAAMLLC